MLPPLAPITALSCAPLRIIVGAIDDNGLLNGWTELAGAGGEFPAELLAGMEKSSISLFRSIPVLGDRNCAPKYELIVVVNELIMKLEICHKKLLPGFKMSPIQFEKDDDTNYHMDLIAAIATSTAMATGLVCLELYKVLDEGHKLEDYRNTFANLALPLFSMAEPVPPKVIKHQDMSWTVWDRWIVGDNPTLRELLQWLKDKALNAYSISFGSCLLYNSMFPRHRERMDRKMVDLAREVAKAELPPYRRHFDVVVACEDDEDNDVDIPQVSIYFR